MRLFVLVALLFILGIAPTHAQSILYVDADAPDGGDGTSWTTAFNDLQDALAAARTNADTVEQIWVADGIYYPVEAGGDPLVSFEMIDGVSLYGGFIGTEMTLAERDLEANPPTILSGGDNFTALIILAEDVRVTIDGLTVTQGGARNSYKVGGLHVTGSHLTLRNLVVEENGVENRAARGGLYMESSTAEITDVLFRANEATSAGGGAYFESSNVVLQKVYFASNLTYSDHAYGGGLFARNSRIIIRDSNFTGNRSANGGAIGTINSMLRIDATRFVGNHVQSITICSGGAIHHREPPSNDPGLITNSLFYANSAAGDGGVGGAVDYQGATETDQFFIANSLFLGNRTSGYLGAPGGAVFARIGRLLLVNNVLIGNESDDFDQRDSDGAAAYGAVTLHNSIVWGNEEAPFLLSNDEDSIIVSHSIVEDGHAGEKVINADPLFVRMPSPGVDERWGTDDDDLGDLHLQEGSPAIDFGLNDALPSDLLDLDEDSDTSERLPLDYEGNPRIQGIRIDLGSYESPYTASEDPWGEEAEPGDDEEPREDDPIVPSYEVYPSPARSQVSVDLVIAEPASFTIAIYDALGRRLRMLHDGFLEPGSQKIFADDLNVAAGIYFVVIESATMREVVPIIIIP